MNLDEKKLALSFGGTTAVIWIICSALVALIPGPTGTLTGHMLHGNLEGFTWTLTWAGFFIGLVSWVLWAAAAGGLIGWSYNRSAGQATPERFGCCPDGAVVIRRYKP